MTLAKKGTLYMVKSHSHVNKKVHGLIVQNLSKTSRLCNVFNNISPHYTPQFCQLEGKHWHAYQHIKLMAVTVYLKLQTILLFLAIDT